MCGPKSESGLSGESPGRGRGLADAGGWSPEGRYFPGPFSSCFLADPAGFLGETGGGGGGLGGTQQFLSYCPGDRQVLQPGTDCPPAGDAVEAPPGSPESGVAPRASGLTDRLAYDLLRRAVLSEMPFGVAHSQ